MIVFKKRELRGSSELTAVLIHGFKGNLKSLDVFLRVFEGFSVAYSLQAPIPVGEDEFSWYTDSQVQDSVDQVVEFVKDEKIEPARSIFLGFSQGGVVISEIKLRIPQVNVISLCSKVSDKIYSTGRTTAYGELLYYVGAEDQIIDPEISLEGYKIYKNLFKSATLFVDNTGHKVSSFGVRFLKSWVRSKFLKSFIHG